MNKSNTKFNNRVLFVSGELIAGDVAYRLKMEGCDVKLYIEDESRKDCFDWMVEKTDDWEKELDWVGKDGLIVFDDVGYGKTQDDLRREGYHVVGGCEMSDKLEQDREFGQEILKQHGVNILSSYNFSSIEDAIDFIRKNPKKWVVKQNGHTSVLNYVGEMEDGSDSASVLKTYINSKFNDAKVITLQEKIDGIEIGVARYFNGNDWIGPIEINVEHKSLMNDDIGPKTAEMGTVMWYTDDENFKLYKESLGKLKSFLQKINFKGDVDIDFIVNEKGAYPLEFTTRFGSPAVHLQDALHDSKWKEFMMSVATGEAANLKYKKGMGVVVCLSIPPFPYKSINTDYYSKGINVFFKEKLSEDELKNVHFEEVSFDDESGRYYIAGSNGFILYVTAVGRDINEAREKVYSLVNKIIIPKMFYRTDIGSKFANEDYFKVKKWGWI